MNAKGNFSKLQLKMKCQQHDENGDEVRKRQSTSSLGPQPVCRPESRSVLTRRRICASGYAEMLEKNGSVLLCAWLGTYVSKLDQVQQHLLIRLRTLLMGGQTE